jgi:imidazolonepropionase-like amidohydrolase
MRKLLLLFLSSCVFMAAIAQPTFPVNGVADQRSTSYAFVHATIVRDGQATLSDATMVIRDGKILSVGAGVSVPADAIVIDCKGKFIYPSFIDAYADYGIPTPSRPQVPGNLGFFGAQQLNSNQKGAYGWNQAIRADVEGARLFTVDASRAKSLRELGFGAVLTHQRDGIARGTGTLVTLAEQKENKIVLKDRASAHYSFNKGTSLQNYPSSMMGNIALLRQTYLDANWYRNNPTAGEGVNLTLQAWNRNQDLPQIFEAGDKWNAIRADRIGDEFGVQYIIKGGGNEYQRIQEVAATRASFILPLNYPQAMDVEDPGDARFVALSDMKHWEMAPGNAAAFEKAGIPFCLTTSDLRDIRQFIPNLRKAIQYGLSEARALDALTRTPARLLGVDQLVGTLDPGKLANFIITSGPVFDDKTVVLQNWVQGEKYSVKDESWHSAAGQYTLAMVSPQGTSTYALDVKSMNAASVIGKDTVNAKFSHDGKLVKLSFAPDKKSRGQYRLSGVSNGDSWSGSGVDSAGNRLTWTATLKSAAVPKAETAAKKPETSKTGPVPYPFLPYGWTEKPKQETILIRNATVWTSEAAGKLEQTDVLVKNGKIAAIGKNLSDAGARVIDGTGRHLTPGIIDEHSHIAAASINEGGQSVTSEVRIADNLNPDDINIYRQLSGGVTTSHILHGSANTIGGQTQLIKLRWGADDEGLKFKGAPGFIKFALGENVKRSSLPMANQRFPDTRMGVEQVLVDAFTRAKDYQREIDRVSAELKSKKGTGITDPFRLVRRDLELDALVEIMNKQRFITCHSYVQSEINAAMKVGEQMGFTFNTFTHILEGYKVADKMKAHGAHASTFSDWWGYKMEVYEAIPQGPAIMHKVGLNVAINSDDAEMARRLNQEAAKSIKYGLTEEEALKMVTINPAKMLHVDQYVGSIKVGKDADLVLWSDNPLSIYAKAEKTIVDGIVYFDRQQDEVLRRQVAAERNRLVQKMVGEKRSGNPVVPFTPSYQVILNCGDHAHSHGLFTIDQD